MRDDKNSFRHESLQDRESIREILEAVTRGIASGKVSFSDADDKIVMKPEGLLHLKLTASREDGRQRINIRISWEVENTRVKKKSRLKVLRLNLKYFGML